MLSRVAERVYWMSRYLERAQNTARLINVHTTLLMDLPEVSEINWFNLVRIFDADTGFEEHEYHYSEITIMNFVIGDLDNSSSLMSSVKWLRENVRTTLDMLPEEVWEQVNQIYIKLQEAQPALSSRHQRQLALRVIINGCQRIRGILDCHISRDKTLDFIQIGKHIERADMTSRILEMTSVLLSETRSQELKRYEGILWTNMLQTLGARQMYLQHMNPRINGKDVLRFLVQDSLFPRSLLYSLKQVERYLQRIPNPDQVVANTLRSVEKLQSVKVDEIAVDEIQVFMDQLQVDLGVLHKEIAENWFQPDLHLKQVQSQSQS